jgi:hypothetical protein
VLYISSNYFEGQHGQPVLLADNINNGITKMSDLELGLQILFTWLSSSTYEDQLKEGKNVLVTEGEFFFLPWQIQVWDQCGSINKESLE